MLRLSYTEQFFLQIQTNDERKTFQVASKIAMELKFFLLMCKIDASSYASGCGLNNSQKKFINFFCSLSSNVL